MTPGVRRALRLVAGGALLAFVLVSVDLPDLWSRLLGSDLRLVVPALAGLVAIHAVAAAGWRSIVIASGGPRLALGEALRIHYAGQALGGVTPANLGGDAYRVAAMRAAGHRWATSVGPIVLQRATSYLALSALSVVALASLATTPAAGPIVLLGTAFAAAVAAAAWLLLAPPRAVRGIAERCAAWLGFPAAPVDAGLAPGRLRRAAAIGLVNGVVFHASGIVLTWLLVLAVDRSAASLVVLAALTVARLSLAVPISPSGIGLQEGALVALVAAVGGPAESALAGLLIARLALVLTTLIGLGLAVRPHRLAPLAARR